MDLKTIAEALRFYALVLLVDVPIQAHQITMYMQPLMTVAADYLDVQILLLLITTPTLLVMMAVATLIH
jgi:hypothetical protein